MIEKSDLNPEEKMQQLRKIKNLQKALEDDQCFFKIDIDTAISILYYLGIEKSELMNYYKKLIAPSQYKVSKGLYDLIDEEKRVL